MGVSAVFAARTAQITGLNLIETVGIQLRAIQTFDRLETVAGNVQAVNDRVERLHQPRGILLLSALIVLSNLIAGALLFTLFLALTSVFSRIELTQAFAESIAGGFIVTIVLGLFGAVGRKVWAIVRPPAPSP